MRSLVRLAASALILFGSSIPSFAQSGPVPAMSNLYTDMGIGGSATATGGSMSRTNADHFSDRLGPVDTGVDRSGVVDAGQITSSFLAGRTGIGGSVQGYFPKGAYTFGAAVNPQGRAPTWIVAQDANLNAYNLAQNGGWVVRPHRTVAWTFGTYDNATGASIIANAPYDQQAQVNGYSTPSSLSGNADGMGSVGLYTSNNAPPADSVPAGTYTAITVIPTTPVNTALLQVGMAIETQHNPYYTGLITGWSVDGSSITVSGWFAVGNSAAGQVPSSGVAFYLNPIDGIWAQNSVVFLNANSEAHSEIGYELDVFNNKSAYSDNVNPVLASPLSWGFYAAGLGTTYAAGVGFIQSGWFYDGFRSLAAQHAGFRVSGSGARNPTYGFLYDIGGYGIAYAAVNDTTGNSWFSVNSGTTMTLGDGSATSVINLYGEQATGTPVRDGQILGASGGVLALRANTIQLGNTLGQQGLTVTAVVSAVNTMQITGEGTGTGPLLTATGSDPAIDLVFAPKGAGMVNISGTSATAATTPASFSAASRVQIKINGVAYWIPASTTAW